jgi:hypothetical protein
MLLVKLPSMTLKPDKAKLLLHTSLAVPALMRDGSRVKKKNVTAFRGVEAEPIMVQSTWG